MLLLIIADDFTGALDTGVQFAAHGVSTCVSVGTIEDFSTRKEEVLVVDTESRHLSAGEAYELVAKLTKRAKAAGVRYIYKKTDSALRGNVGAELAAVMAASGCEQLPFLPAFPQIGRVLRDGVLYIDGVPVSESPFGIDPFSPVGHSVVTELIAEQCDLPTRSFPPCKEEQALPQNKGILIFDAASTEDLYHTGKQLLEQGGLRVMAGCAGFGAVLPKLLGVASDGLRQSQPKLDPRLLIVCGSVNPITRAQLDSAERAGFSRLRLTPSQKLQPDYWESEEGKAELTQITAMLDANDYCIIETNDEDGNRLTADYADRLGLDTETVRVRIASGLGQLVASIFTDPALGTLLLTGGDTLLQCMNSIGVSELSPICELEKGVVLARFAYKGCTRYVITKSGGFGQETLLTDLAARIAKPITQTEERV